MSIRLCFLSLLMVFGCVACNSGSSVDFVHTSAIEIVEQLDGDQAMIKRSQTIKLDKINAYVDFSQSMMGYLSDNTSTYRDFVEAVYNRTAGNTQFNAFGFVTKSGQSVDEVAVSDVLKAQSYVRLNNDYGQLFNNLRQDETSLVITDGVQSDPNEGAIYGPIVDAVDNWVQGGGLFAILLYRSSFSGKYFYEGRGQGTIRCEVPNRPFVVYAFMPSTEALEELLERLGSSLQPDHILSVGGNDMVLEPSEYMLRLDSRDNYRLDKKILHSTEEVDEIGLAPYHRTTVITTAVNDAGYLPLQFDVTLPLNSGNLKELTKSEAQVVLNQLATRSSVDAWQLTPPPRGQSDEEGGQATADIRRVNINVDDIEVFVTESDDSMVKARLSIPVKKPVDDAEDFAWVLTLRLGQDGADNLVPENFSTSQDYEVGECDKILNIKPFIGTILRENYIPARTFLYTKWR